MKKQNQLKALAFAAILTAMSVALSYFSVRVGEVYKFGFSKLPVVIAGIALGPVWGAFVGAASDLIGAIFAGLGINLLFTIPPVLLGIFPWVFMKIFRGGRSTANIIIMTVAGRVLLSGLLLTVLLGYVYGWFTPISKFYTMLSIRLVTAAVESVIEGIICIIIFKNESIMKIFRRNEVLYDC